MKALYGIRKNGKLVKFIVDVPSDSPDTFCLDLIYAIKDNQYETFSDIHDMYEDVSNNNSALYVLPYNKKDIRGLNEHLTTLFDKNAIVLQETDPSTTFNVKWSYIIDLDSHELNIYNTKVNGKAKRIEKLTSLPIYRDDGTSSEVNLKQTRILLTFISRYAKHLSSDPNLSSTPNASDVLGIINSLKAQKENSPTATSKNVNMTSQYKNFEEPADIFISKVVKSLKGKYINSDFNNLVNLALFTDRDFNIRTSYNGFLNTIKTSFRERIEDEPKTNSNTEKFFLRISTFLLAVKDAFKAMVYNKVKSNRKSVVQSKIDKKATDNKSVTHKNIIIEQKEQNKEKPIQDKNFIKEDEKEKSDSSAQKSADLKSNIANNNINLELLAQSIIDVLLHELESKNINLKDNQELIEELLENLISSYNLNKEKSTDKLAQDKEQKASSGSGEKIKIYKGNFSVKKNDKDEDDKDDEDIETVIKEIKEDNKDIESKAKSKKERNSQNSPGM